MARGSKINLNRAALDQVTLALADGLFAVGKTLIGAGSEIAPDSPYMPYPAGEGLPKQGGVLAYHNGKKIGGFGLDGKQPRVPRAAHISRSAGVVVIVGWGFPARFNEFGTIRTPAQPFFAATADATLPKAASIMAPIVGPELPKP